MNAYDGVVKMRRSDEIYWEECSFPEEAGLEGGNEATSEAGLVFDECTPPTESAETSTDANAARTWISADAVRAARLPESSDLGLWAGRIGEVGAERRLGCGCSPSSSCDRFIVGVMGLSLVLMLALVLVPVLALAPALALRPDRASATGSSYHFAGAVGGYVSGASAATATTTIRNVV